MPTRPLPERPNLRHLRNQAKDVLKSGEAKTLTQAQFKIARLYGFASWARLKQHLDSLEEIGQLKQAIDTNDLERVQALMTTNPALHRAPLGYNKNGPLTWVAECRVPREPPGPRRLAMAQWMIDHGSDVHQGGDGPLMRASLGDRIPMMELLLANGADVNAEWNGSYPIVFGPCESVDPAALQWLLDHGANPNCDRPGRGYRGTALDQLIATYWRSPDLAACIDILLRAGGTTRYNIPSLLAMLRRDYRQFADLLDADPGLLHRRFAEFDFGGTAERRLSLQGATLLHAAAEYGDAEAAGLLLDRGTPVDIPALDEAGVGGQTPLFHAVTQNHDYGFDVVRLLLDRGASLRARARLPGHYERPEEFIDCTPLGYARRFPGVDGKVVQLLRASGAPE
jgi:ankyrin repeat protein